VLLLIVWLSLQFVIDERIKEQAATYASDLFTWDWAQLGAKSTFNGTSIKILKRSNSLAKVQVFGLQKLYKIGNTYTYNVSTVLSLYKMSGNWLLGKAELQ
jgi:hypothetical protein